MPSSAAAAATRAFRMSSRAPLVRSFRVNITAPDKEYGN